MTMQTLQAKPAPARQAGTTPTRQARFQDDVLTARADRLNDSHQVHQLKSKAAQLQTAMANAGNGLPVSLKAGVESLSGMSMDHVNVHYNSAKPAQLNAHAYTQGSDIHVAPGQERHVPHEAWHVVQQAQGRVQPTVQMVGIGVNDDRSLEAEADAMGARAASIGTTSTKDSNALIQTKSASSAVAQCFGQIRFANLNNTPLYVQKEQAIIKALKASNFTNQYLSRKNVLFTIAAAAQPAEIAEVGDQVQITMGAWFFESQSVGRILGLLAHEFGVHTLASERMTPMEHAQEANSQNTLFGTGIAGHTVTPQQAGQADHIFASVANQPRFETYRQTAYEMAAAMLSQSQNGGGVTEIDVTDVIMTYLSDMAMILATNDHRVKILVHPFRTAQIFNLERTRWLSFLTKKKKRTTATRLATLTPAERSATNVLGETLSVGWNLTSGLKSKLPSFLRDRLPLSHENSMDETNYQHAPAAGNAIAPTTRIQAKVLADHRLVARPLPNNANGFFDAVDTAPGMANSRQTALGYMLQYPAAGPQVPTVRQWILNHPAIHTELTFTQINIISWSLQHQIRVLQPDGNMMAAATNYGPPVNIIWVRQPQPHYLAT